MPRYEITSPDGRKFEVTAPEGASQAEVLAYAQANYTEPAKKSTVGSELKRGAQQLASSMQTAYGAVAGSPEEAARAGLERSDAISQIAGEGVGFDPVKKAFQEKGLLSAAGELVSQIPRALAGQGANLATMAGGARLGAMAGSAVAPGPGTLVGGALGAGAALLPQLFGSNVESQAAAQMERGEPVKIDRTKAGVAAAGQAALEGAGAAFTLGKGVVKGILGITDDAAVTSAKAARQLEATAQRSLAASVGRGAARGAVVEMPVEVAQQVIERAQAGQDLTSPEAFAAYGDAAYQAGLVGGPLGGAGNIVTRGQAQDKLAAQAKAAEQQRRAEIEARGPQVPAEAPAGTQGEMFTSEEMGTAPKPEPLPKTPAPAPTVEPTGEQDDLGLDYQREYADLAKERERLTQVEQTPEVKARVAELTDQMALYTQSDIESIRAESETAAATAKADAEAAARFPALATAPDLLTQSDEVKARTQGELFPGEDLGTAPPTEAIAEPKLRPKREVGPTQMPLGLRRNPEGQPTTFGEPEPTLTSADIMLTAIPVPKGVEGWLAKNVVGSTRTQLDALIAKDPTLVQGNTPRAKILRSLTAADVPAFKEAPSVKPTPAKTPAVEQRDEPRAGEPSVGVPSEPAAPIVSEPGAGAPATAEAPVTPNRRRLVPAGRPAVPRAEPKGAEPTAVATETADEEAARKAEADDFKRRLEALDKAKPAAPAAKPAAAAPKKAEPSKPIPEKMYEPTGTSEFGMEEGQKEILRGPQAMLFPMSKREEIEYAERRQAEADKNDDVGPAPEVDARQMELPFPPDEEVMVRAIDGKTVLEAANWAANNLPDADQQIIAKRVAATLRELQSIGVVMGPVKITPKGQQLVSGARGFAGLKPGPNGMPSTVRLTLNHPSNGSQSGTTPEILLHELIHTATMGTLSVGNRRSAAQTRIGKTVSQLYGVAKAVLDHVDAKHARGEPLTAVEKQLRTNYMRDVDEILAWTMTNRDMQAYMETVPYKSSNLWTQFVQAIRNVLGLTAKADTALSEILRIGGDLTDLTAADLQETATATGKQFSVSPGTESLIDGLGPLEAEEKPLIKRVVNGFKAGSSPAEPSYATKFRTQTADAAATIEHRLRERFDGAVRDSLGKLNPMGLYRQAQDHAKLLLEYFQQGSLVKDTATGLWRVGTTKGVRPPAEVYALIDKYAEKNGYSRERATQIASRVLEGVRLDAMRASNKSGATNFALHLKDAEIDQLVSEYKADPDLREMSKLMDEARLAMVDNMVAVGRLTKETGEAWKDTVGYVPFDRLDDEDFVAAFSKIKKISNKGLAQVGKLPELVGSIERPVGNVFDNYLNTLGWMVGQTMKTDGTVQTLRSLEDISQATKLRTGAKPTANSVGAYVKGEMQYWDLPSKYDVMAFKDLNPPKAHWLRALGSFSNVLRKSVTVLPPFALKQVTDDVQRAIMTSGVKNPGALLRMSLTNFPKLALAELRGIQHPMVREFGALGLTGEYDFQAGKPATSLLKDLGYKPRGKFETLIHRLDGITRASDLAVRKAIYDQTLKESNNDEVLAQTRAREFINFRRRGASDFVGAMVTTIPFFNAYIQGMDVLYRAASGKDSSSSVDRAQARRMFWSRASTVMMLSSLYALGKGDDDEEYNEMDLRTRDGNWILPGGYKIPVPTELGALFKVVPERIVEYMRRQGTPEEQTAWEATRTALAYIMEQYVGRTVPVPQGVKPLLEAWTNYSFFTGRELEGIYQKQQDPSLRRASNTSELAIAIANFSKNIVGVDKVSPILIDNALSGYFGSSAGLLVAMTDSLLNPTRVDRPLHKYALISNYMYDPVGTRRMTEFYDEREKVGRANTTLRELMNTDLDKAAEYAEKNAEALMLESAVNSTLEQLERTRAYRKYLNGPLGAEEMSKEEREASLKEVKQMEVDLTKWLREAKTAVRQ